jgi:hypothetical protein
VADDDTWYERVVEAELLEDERLCGAKAALSPSVDVS